MKISEDEIVASLVYIRVGFKTKTKKTHGRIHSKSPLLVLF